jgi:hypothetical protein
MEKTLKKGIDNIRKYVSGKSWVEQIVDDFLDSRVEEDRSGRDFHPSAAGGCPRVIQLSMMGLICQKHEARVKRIFDTGHDMHNRYKRYFERAGKLVEEEAAVVANIEGISIRGRADLIVKDFNGNKRLLELKTVNSRRYEEVVKNGIYYEDHYTQWNIYSGILKLDGEILYENKDDQRMKVFTIEFNQEKFNKSIGMFKLIDYHIQNGILCPKPDVCDARYCIAKEYCKKNKETGCVIDTTMRIGKK